MSLAICLLLIIAGQFIWSFIDRYNHRDEVRRLKIDINGHKIAIKTFQKELKKSDSALQLSSNLVRFLVINHDELKRFSEIEGIEVTNTDTGITYILSHHEGQLQINTGVPWGDVPEEIKDIEN